MDKMKTADKKELARQLFLHTTMFQNEIANYVGVTNKTMNAWCKDWKDLKDAYSVTKDEVVAQCYKAIAAIFKESTEKKSTLTAAQCDQLNKLGSLIEKVEKKVTLPVIIQVFKEFDDYLKRIDIDLAKKVNHHHSLFINSRISNE